MRKIKFRAWVPEEQRMTNIFEIGGGQQSEKLVDLSYGASYKGWEVIQYTGLKDKNGKEIYEGDILLANLKDKLEATVYNREFTISVEYDDGVLNIADRWGYSGERFLDIYEVEIVGNIYQNPELLNS